MRCTCSRTDTCSIYASPLPPLRRILYIYSHHNTNKKDSTLLVKLTSLLAVRQSDGRRPRGSTESVTREYRVSCRTTIDCMWPKHVCMKGLCNVLNNEFMTLMWQLPNKTANPHDGSQLVVYCEPPATPRLTHPHTHRESTTTTMHVKLIIPR